MQSQTNVQSQTSLTGALTVTLALGRKPSDMAHRTKVSTTASPPAPAGRVPRISRLMALAIHFDDLLRRGEVKDYAELARLGHVSRARVTQIMNLLNLAPDIQEQLLFLPPVERGRDLVKEWMVRPVATQTCWSGQRQLWRRLGSIDRQSTTG